MSITYVHVLVATMVVYAIIMAGSIKIGWNATSADSRLCGFHCVRYHNVARFCDRLMIAIAVVIVVRGCVYYLGSGLDLSDQELAILSILAANFMIARAVEVRVRTRMRVMGCRYWETYR